VTTAHGVTVMFPSVKTAILEMGRATVEMWEELRMEKPAATGKIQHRRGSVTGASSRRTTAADQYTREYTTVHGVGQVWRVTTAHGVTVLFPSVKFHAAMIQNWLMVSVSAPAGWWEMEPQAGVDVQTAVGHLDMIEK